MSLGLAFRAFFAVLSGREAADRVKVALQKVVEPPKEVVSQPSKAALPAAPPTEAAPRRSEALTLLSALQREARLVDLIMEPLEGVEDAAIGAAVREVLRDSQKTLVRMFDLQAIAEGDEGDPIDLPGAPSPAKYRLVGSASSQSKRGTITHRGWRAAKCEVPKWTGTAAESQLIAPIEVEIAS